MQSAETGGPEPPLHEASALVVRGVNVIPLRGKRPTIEWKRWQTERQLSMPPATLDAYLLEKFGPPGSGVGAVTGQISGIVVLDADDRAAWDRLGELCGGSLPRTVTTLTAKGRHVWFLHPGGNVANRARIGGVALDVRGDGGYVVVPPTAHPSGSRYAWLVSPLELWPPAKMPPRLLELVRPPARPVVVEPVRARAGRYAEAALAGEVGEIRTAPVGTRNDRLNAAAHSLGKRFVRSGELPPEKVAGALLAAALANGLPELEARRTIASGLRAGAA